MKFDFLAGRFCWPIITAVFVFGWHSHSMPVMDPSGLTYNCKLIGQNKRHHVKSVDGLYHLKWAGQGQIVNLSKKHLVTKYNRTENGWVGERGGLTETLTFGEDKTLSSQLMLKPGNTGIRNIQLSQKDISRQPILIAKGECHPAPKKK